MDILSTMQGRAPEHLMGKMTSCVFTRSMYAQPIGKMVYGTLSGRFTGRAAWVLSPSGPAACAFGLLSRKLFVNSKCQSLSREPQTGSEHSAIPIES